MRRRATHVADVALGHRGSPISAVQSVSKGSIKAHLVEQALSEQLCPGLELLLRHPRELVLRDARAQFWGEREQRDRRKPV